MNWLPRLDQTSRLILISIVLGVVGALGATFFLLLLRLTETWALGFIGHYHTIQVAEAHVVDPHFNDARRAFGRSADLTLYAGDLPPSPSRTTIIVLNQHWRSPETRSCRHPRTARRQ